MTKKHNLLKISFSFFLLILFSKPFFAICYSDSLLIDSSNLEIQNRVLVTITEKKNIVSLDLEQGISSVTIISAKPLDGLDFREYPSLVIKVEVDGREEVNIKLMDLVKGNNKKKNIAYFPVENYTFDKFDKNLKIIIEDLTMDLKKFKIDLWLFLR